MHQLELFCGLKSGVVEVYDQNILLQHTLEGHKREVVDLAVSPELLVTISKDMQVITWSTKTKVRKYAMLTQYCGVKVCYCCVSMTVPPMSVRILSDQVWLGLETGQISVFLHLGRGHLVKKKVNKLGISCAKLSTA